MSVRLSVLLLASLPRGRAGPDKAPLLPPDIDPVTLSRLPPVTPQDLDEEGRKLLAARPDFKPGPGPGHVTIYSPQGAHARDPIGREQPGRPAGTFSSRC